MLLFEWKREGRGRHSAHHRPRLTVLKEARCNSEATVVPAGGRCTGCFENLTGMPVWLRRSHSPGWEGVMVAVAPGRNVVAAAQPGREKSASTAPDRNQEGNWIYHGLWRCMTSTIKINECDIPFQPGKSGLVTDLNRESRSWRPADILLFICDGAGDGEFTTTATRIGE